MKLFRPYTRLISIVSDYKKDQRKEKDISLCRAYDAVGDSKIRKPSQYKFVVREGYKYAKIWVKALKRSSDIICTITDSQNELVSELKVSAGHVESQVIYTPPGTYIVKLTSSSPGKMKGQFNIKVAPRTDELYEEGYRNDILLRAYEPVGGSITNIYSFKVQSGYSCFKIWVKAFKNSADISCVITKDSITGVEVKTLSIPSGTEVFKVLNATKGTYFVRFNATGSMNEQFNIKVGQNATILN